ncbi:MAG: hypothetical protein F4Z42_15125 [Holophagales bacterium]|nr:hypothetical protein [Holophagales bacterium]
MTRRIAPAGAVLGSLLLCGCSAVGTPEPACRPLEVAEFPLLGGIRGTWMDDERFVLADLHQSRLLVYSTSEGLVRIVNGWETEDLALNFVSPMDVEPWGRGYVLADSDVSRPDRLLELGRDLRPRQLLWEGDIQRVADGWSGKEVFSVDELVALRSRLYVRGGRRTGPQDANREYAEFGSEPVAGQRSGALRETSAWPGYPGELDAGGMAFSHLAEVGASDHSVFALRYSPAVFLQELVGEGRSLKAFPELPTPLPTLPQASQDRMAEFYAALEASSYPAGLYGDEDSLYVLMRDATGGEPGWDLHRIDPQRDEVIGRVRLPTKAAHVSLLPGRRYWVLEESSSGLDRSFRPPIRFLLLSSAALRAGEVPSCD